MVLIKRKPVQYVSPPPILDNNVEVWVMPETGEVFLDYESYLARRDFYKQKKFTCEITGHSGLTFFEAKASETLGSKELESTFPEALREPVLRRVQFSRISRIDDLVTTVYEEFKDNYTPGEHVIVLMENGDRFEGIVRSRTDFGSQIHSNGTRTAQFSKYLVGIEGQPGQPNEMYLLKNQLTRDRKIFTKQTLRSFLKKNLQREAWQGAPWLVKEEVAKELKIPMEIPPHLQHGAVIEQKRARQAEGGGTFFNFLTHQQRSVDARPAGRGQTNHFLQQDFNGQNQDQHIMFLDGRTPVFSTTPVPNSFHDTPYASHLHKLPMLHPGPIRGPPPRPPAPPPPPPIKYPIDDLDIHPRHNGLQRPSLRFIVEDPPKPKAGKEVKSETTSHSTGILMKSMGALLEIWNTLNVHAEVFVIDSFTLDDFMDAMRFKSDELECELFVEMHCAVLKQLVNADGQIQVSLPDLEEEDEEEDEDESTLSTPLPEVAPKPERRTTRSSLAKAEAEALKQPSPSVSDHRIQHRAAEMLADYGWVERLAARDFSDGGWQVVMVGLLRQMALDPHQKDTCDKILAQLAPADQEPTPETARRQYNELDVNDRLAALEIAVMLATRTKAIRNYLEECSSHMTTLRKEKIEWQRKRKPLVQELQELDEQRKMLLPDNMPSSPLPEVSEIVDSSMTGIEDTDKDEDDEQPVRVLRRSNDRANDRKRKRDEEIARKEKEKQEKAAATSKQSAQFKKVLRDIEKKKEAIRECEDKIADFDNDLREANCQRTKCLGRDRFCNRYYWFERNGMPFAGMPDSSAAHYGYVNGRLWVQGPDDSERKGFIDLEEPAQTEYRNSFGMTVPERRLEEEGPIQLYNANHWGYIDDPDAADQLIGWLDERGIRERNLRKELQIWRAPIVEYMQKLRAHKEAVEEKRREAEDVAAKGVKTRHQTYVPPASLHQCLAWKNSYAVDRLGHKHSEQPRPKKLKSKKESVNAKVPMGRSGKPLTRQGTQYAKR